jgi:flagellar biosynthesis anti-sigma factor FlgM
MSISELNGQERLRATMAAAALRKNSVSASPTTGSVTRQPDAVSISDAGRALASARAKTEGTAATREARISQIKAAVSAGTYDVSSRTLANTLVRNYAQ